MDGTLVDTVLDISLAVNHALISLNASPLEVDEIRRYVGHGLNDLLKKCLRSEDQDRIEKASAIFGDYYSLHLADNSCPYPYVEETLEYFKKKKQAVFTNKPNPFSRDLIRCLGLEKYFIEVIACGAEYPKKPDPAAVDMLVSSQKVSKEQTLLVGDSIVDIETGRRAGIVTVIVAQGFCDRKELVSYCPEIMVDDFREFLQLVKRESW